MTSRLDISEETKDVLRKILDADGSDFVHLTRIAGLRPSVDFVGADLRGVDFGTCDLSGYDFSDADLRDARLNRARLEGAIFVRARTEGAVWPRKLSRGEEHALVPRRARQIELLGFQHAAVAAALDALIKETPWPIIAMPTGTGKHRVLEALLEALDQRGMLRQALILSGARSSAEQLQRALVDEYGADAVAPVSRALSALRGPLTQKLIVGNLDTIRLDRTSKAHPLPAANGGISHIVIMDARNLQQRLRMLDELYPEVPVLAFVSEGWEEKSFGWDVKGKGTLVFALGYDDAVSAGVLRPANIQVRRTSTSPDNDSADISATCEDIVELIETFPRDFVGAVVCKNIEHVKTVALQLHGSLSQIHHGRDQSFRRVVQHTSTAADGSLVQAAIDVPGTILVLTEQVYNHFDWSAVNFAFVLTKLKRPELIAFPRLRRDHALVVIDYSGSFDAIRF